jgi:hypothetical protein
MSFTPAAAPTETVSVMETSDKQLSVFRIHEVRTQYGPDGKIGRLIVSWSKGYMNGDEYVPASSTKTQIESDEMKSKLAGFETPVWELLNSAGLLPAGSVTV